MVVIRFGQSDVPMEKVVAAAKKARCHDFIMKLPLGYVESEGTGKIRKIVSDSSAATETYLAHNLPDKAVSIATPIALLAVMAVFDWRLGLLSLVPVLLGFLIMMAMTGQRMQEKMKEYQNALDDMSNEAVEYVRGIPVVKTFGQTIFSFKKFKDSIDRYKVWVIAYTKQLRAPMMFYTAAINGVFAALIAGALIFTEGGVTPDFLLDLMFYIIITPIISVTLTRIMFQSENAMIVAEAGLPNHILVMVQQGATSPIRYAGSVAVHNADFLAFNTLLQCVNRGNPTLYGASACVMDMKKGLSLVAAPEVFVLNAAMARMSKYYNIPSYIAGG